MSRSYKYPVWKDKANKYVKRMASKAVRRCKDLENYKGYALLKKLFNSWNICDYKWYPDKEEDKLKAKRK